MTPLKRIYERTDAWARALSRGQYAVLLGLSGGVGVLLTGLLLTEELFVVQALMMALVMFGLEYAFGLHQPTDG